MYYTEFGSQESWPSEHKPSVLLVSHTQFLGRKAEGESRWERRVELVNAFECDQRTAYVSQEPRQQNGQKSSR